MVNTWYLMTSATHYLQSYLFVDFSVFACAPLIVLSANNVSATLRLGCVRHSIATITSTLYYNLGIGNTTKSYISHPCWGENLHESEL